MTTRADLIEACIDATDAYRRAVARWPVHSDPEVAAEMIEQAARSAELRTGRPHPTLAEVAVGLPALLPRLPAWERMIAAEARLRGSDDR